MATDLDMQDHAEYSTDDNTPIDYYHQIPDAASPGFKVSGIYPTRMGRQDLNFTSPEQAQYIRKVHRDPVKDIDWYRVYHGRNLGNIKEIKMQQRTLKKEQIEAEQKHQDLLDKIRRQSQRRRSIIRNRTKSTTEIQKPITQKTQSTKSQPKQHEESSRIEENLKIDLHSKPKWSLTEAENDMVMDNEVDELLDFVDSLQFDDFMEDMEMQQKLSTIKDRIENLQRKEKELNTKKLQIEQNEREALQREYESQNAGESDKENMFADIREVPPMSTHKIGEMEMMMEGDTGKSEDGLQESTTDEIAGEALKTNLRNIHSKQSIRSILDTQRTTKNPWSDVATRKINAIMKQQENDPIDSCERIAKCNEPRQFTASERLPPLKIRQKLNGSDINNLPYLFRHPGV